MAKLNRLTAKIFGETASTTNTPKEIGQFGSAKAGTYNATGDVAIIQSLPAWSNGWIGAVTPTDQFPPLPEMTGVHKVLSYQNAYLLQQGIPEWDGATTYYTNSFCSKADKIYVSLSDDNLNNDPEIDTVNWKVFESDAISQHTKFAINKGNTELLLAPGSGTVDVTVSDPTTCGGGFVGEQSQSIIFPSPKTLLSVSALCTSWPNWNGDALAQVFAILNDNSEILLGQAYTAQTGYRTDVNVNYEFDTPTIVKGLRLYVLIRVSGSAYVADVSYVERASVSTAENLYFNTTIENPITYTNVLGETRTEVGLLPINVANTANGNYKVVLPQTGNQPYLFNGNIYNTEDVTKKLKENINIIGNLTNNDGILSGFSTNDYATTPQVFNPASNTWEILFKIKTSSDVTTDQYILSNNQTNGFSISWHIINSKFNLYLGSNGSSWNIAENVNGSYTVLANTDYYVKLLFTGTQYKVQYSTDGIAFNDDIVITNSNVISVQSLPMVIGRYLWSGYNATLPWLGSIDLNESYINIGNNTWWATHPVQNDIWLNPQEPYSVKQFDGTDWQDFNDVILQESKVTVLNGVITALEQPKYNNSCLIANKEYITSLGMPDYSTRTALLWNVNYTATTDGIIDFWAGGQNQNTVVLTLNGVQINMGAQVYDAYQVFHRHIWIIPKGTIYKLSGGGSDLYFTSLKGAN